MDMLEVGNGELTDDEQVAHFSMWAALKSPLMMGNDLRTANDDVLSILGNRAVIAISQDSLGAPATNKKLSKGGHAQIWSGPLSGGDFVVVLLNPRGDQVNITATAADIFANDDELVSRSWELYDLWAGRHSGTTSRIGAPLSETLSRNQPITASVATHGVAMFRLRKKQAGSSQQWQQVVGDKVAQKVIAKLDEN